MQEKEICPYYDQCVLVKKLILTSARELIKRRYCTSNYERCARYKLRQSGLAVPETLLPNGDDFEEIYKKLDESLFGESQK